MLNATDENTMPRDYATRVTKGLDAIIARNANRPKPTTAATLTKYMNVSAITTDLIMNRLGLSVELGMFRDLGCSRQSKNLLLDRLDPAPKRLLLLNDRQRPLCLPYRTKIGGS